MNYFQNYVAIPMWLLVLLLFLSSGAVRWVDRFFGRREARAAARKVGSPILLLDDARKERAQ